MIQFQKRFPQEPILRSLIKFYWVVRSHEAVSIEHTLIPTNNSDLILNFGTPISYRDPQGPVQCGTYHFSGIRKFPLTVFKSGIPDTIGISFYPEGIYPFLNIPCSEFTEQVVDLNSLWGSRAAIFDSVADFDSTSERIAHLETILLSLLKNGSYRETKLPAIVKDLSCFTGAPVKLNTYCREQGVSERTLERLFRKNIGITPKAFIKVSRFQQICNHIISGKYNSLTTLAYDYNYYDQNHFIKDFKDYLGAAPSRMNSEMSLIRKLFNFR